MGVNLVKFRGLLLGLGHVCHRFLPGPPLTTKDARAAKWPERPKVEMGAFPGAPGVCFVSPQGQPNWLSLGGLEVNPSGGRKRFVSHKLELSDVGGSSSAKNHPILCAVGLIYPKQRGIYQKSTKTLHSPKKVPVFS